MKKIDNSFEAEFDKHAEAYLSLHKANVSITGEEPEYFAEYKILDLFNHLNSLEISPRKILDFGCGIGNSIPFFRKYFPAAELICSDVSAKSIDISKSRFPGSEQYLKINNNIPLSDNSIDIVFTACVFHHIDHADHDKWLRELLRVTKPDGYLAIYEHNPLNPLTLNAVNTCPFDENAVLITAREMKKRLDISGWYNSQISYKLFFPSFLSFLRPLECYLQYCPIGAQYRMLSKKK